MNQFYQKEIGGVLGAVLVAASTPVLADDYRYGYSSSNVCYRTEYREEYVPGTASNPGYIKSWQDTIEYPCNDRTTFTPTRTRVESVREIDDNDCSDGKIAGGILGGAAGAALSRGDGRWWAIPLGVVAGSAIGCDAAGG